MIWKKKFTYRVPVFKLLEYTVEELSRKNMIILIPFMMLKLRDKIKKRRTMENMKALQTLIFDDIINIINKNQVLGNITSADANKLRGLIQKLYNHLYSHYKEFIEGGLNDMMEDGLVLEADILEAELTEKITKRVTEQVTKELTERMILQEDERVNQVENDMIRRLYSKLNDIKQVAELLEFPLEKVQKAL